MEITIIAIASAVFFAFFYFNNKKNREFQEKQLKNTRDFQTKQAAATRRSQDNQNKATLKTLETVMEKNKTISEMALAGSYQEWKRIKSGNKAVNNIKDEPNLEEITEDKRIPFDDITGVQVDNNPAQKIKIYQ